jgi:hypothetical protein
MSAREAWIVSVGALDGSLAREKLAACFIADHLVTVNPAADASRACADATLAPAAWGILKARRSSGRRRA